MARVLMKGCEAIAEAAVRAGCRFFAGYPITPQNEIPEYFARRLPEVGGNFVQGESEVASINMVYGSASVGARSMTSSSSPGIALKSEGISYCAAARIPIVYANISRGGPGVGAIQPAQQDYFQATKASGNGGFEMIVLAPATVQEAVDLTYKAFDLADRDRNPVLILAVRARRNGSALATSWICPTAPGSSPASGIPIRCSASMKKPLLCMLPGKRMLW